MGNIKETRVVLGSLRFKSASDTDLLFQVPLNSNVKMLTEYLRSDDINLAEVFQTEREKSNKFKPSCKFSVLFKNSLAGYTNYVPFENNLYYLNALEATTQQCLTNSNAVAWTGLPQYNEFDFIRNDSNVIGYTQPNNSQPPHIQFVPKSANTYNWNFFLSYAFENDFDKTIQAIESTSNTNLTWRVGDGIPFIIERNNFNGLDVISFKCPIKHGFNIGDYVKIKFDLQPSYIGIDEQPIDIFEVNYLGIATYSSREYIFSIIDIGYTGSTFNNGIVGTAKRVLDPENPIDTTSKYYVRKHKLLTSVDDAVLIKAGFEENIFGKKKKFESSGYTPNKIARVSIKEGSQSYSLSFNNDIDIQNLLDNQRRPVSEFFFTVIWKGYFGWMFRDLPGGGLKQGWEFNLPLKRVTNRPSDWWTRTNALSETNLQINTYTTPYGVGLGPGNTNLTFCYIDSLNKGDVIDGDVCEWNDFGQTERVISKIHHKLKFNQFAFSTESFDFIENPYGYYYQPHHKMTIRVFSDYIQEIDGEFANEIPNYAYYSKATNTFRWRDLYSYGFVDTSGLGVDYPFTNGSHYPFENFVFRIIPEGTNYDESTIIEQPTIDNCE
jgi:hypothetical protein